MDRQALCIGIDDYPDARKRLRGCANDAGDWAAELALRGFGVCTLVDRKATRAAVAGAVAEMLGRAHSGDVVVLTWSGHGACCADEDKANSSDRGGEEPPGSATVARRRLDPALRECLAARRAGVRVVAIADCCHAGAWAADVPDAIDLLLAGCRDVQRSWDGTFGGRPNGAFTFHALGALRALRRDATYDEWLVRIRASLPSTRAPQEPQIFGAPDGRRARLFD